MSVLQHKSCVITGGAGGLGYAIASAFMAEGASVALLDVNAELVEAAAGQLPKDRARAYVVDVRDRLAVKAAIDDYAESQGGLDILVNNAAAFRYAPLHEMSEEAVDLVLDVGLKGVFWSLQAAIPHLMRRGGGAVINMSSVAVSFSIRNSAVYSSVKGAIDALTRQQAGELGVHGIRVNAIAPGPVATPGANSVVDEQGWEIRKTRSPLRLLATDNDIGAAAVYLASPQARSITGVTLKVDAGITIAGP